MEEEKSKKSIIIFVIVVVLLAAALAAYLINRNRLMQEAENVGFYLETIWEAPSDGSDSESLDFNAATLNVQLERQGFVNGMNAARKSRTFNEILVSEETSMSQLSIRLATLDNYYDIVMSMGATTDRGTLYGTMTTTFFSIPMLIPFSDGDFPQNYNQSYIFRTSVNGNNYENFVRDNIFRMDFVQDLNTLLFENRPIPDYQLNAGIFFRNITNGNENAIRITQVMMDAGVNIDFYEPTTEGSLLTVFNGLAAERYNDLKNLDIVFILGEDQDPIANVEEVVSFWDDLEVKPAIVLISVPPENENLAVKDNVYLIRQKLDMSRCPNAIQTHEEAAGYAAGYITQTVLEQTAENVKPDPLALLYFLETPEQRQARDDAYLQRFREGVWNSLQNIQATDIPCFGKSNDLKLEIVRMTKDPRVTPMDDSEIYRYLVDRVRTLYGGAF